MKKPNFFKRFLAGLGIGTGAAIPGVSGAAIALIFKVYEEIIDSVNNFKQNVKKSLSVLLPILLGVGISVVICIIVFHWAFERCMFLIICIFAGFLIGSLPSVTEQVKGQKPRGSNLVCLILGFIIVVALGVISVLLRDKGFNISGYFEDLNANWWMYFVLILVGIIASVALTIPGFSGSLILLIMGFYRPLLDSASEWGSQLLKGNFDNTLSLFLMILTFGIGCLIGVIFVSKVMRKLLDTYSSQTFFAILGFVIGSIFVLFFNYQIFEYYLYWAGKPTTETFNSSLSKDMEIPVGILILLICAFFSFMLVRASNNIKTKSDNKK